ncbi:MAG: kelch repeat-containing protein, partial [Dehalococcoidia bacterium]
MIRPILTLTLLIISMIAIINCGGSSSTSDGKSDSKSDSADTSADRFKDEPTDAAVSMSPGEFRRAEDMGAKRSGLNAVLLNDGTAFIFGGRTDGSSGFWLNYNFTSEIFDGNTDTWTMSGEMNTARADAIGIVLSDGKVLAAGGEGEQNKAINSTEIWDPATGEWTEISPLIEERDSTDAV